MVPNLRHAHLVQQELLTRATATLAVAFLPPVTKEMQHPAGCDVAPAKVILRCGRDSGVTSLCMFSCFSPRTHKFFAVTARRVSSAAVAGRFLKAFVCGMGSLRLKLQARRTQRTQTCCFCGSGSNVLLVCFWLISESLAKSLVTTTIQSL